MLERRLKIPTISRVQFFNGSNLKVCKFWLKVSTGGKYTGNKQLTQGIIITWNTLLLYSYNRVSMCARSGTRELLWGLTLLLANCVILTKIFTFSDKLFIHFSKRDNNSTYNIRLMWELSLLLLLFSIENSTWH